MTTNTFKVTYASGATTEYNSTCHSVEAFCNEHFGSAWETAKEQGATVVMVEGAAEDDGSTPENPRADGSYGTPQGDEAQDSPPAKAKPAAFKKVVAKKAAKAKK